MTKNTQKVFGLSLLLVLAMFYGTMDMLWKIQDAVKNLESHTVDIYLDYPKECPHCGTIHNRGGGWPYKEAGSAVPVGNDISLTF